jgi:AGCS family alanine or glycine:cation symporter
VILCSGVPIPYGHDAGISLTSAAFSEILGPWVTVLISLSLCLFAVATVLGWGLYGIRCAQYLFGEGVSKKFAWLQILVVLLSALMRVDTVWLLAEIVNGLMAIPNLIALWALSPTLIRIYKNYINGGTYENFYQCQSL